jgi:hypothetical protein
MSCPAKVARRKERKQRRIMILIRMTRRGENA